MQKKIVENCPQTRDKIFGKVIASEAKHILRSLGIEMNRPTRPGLTQPLRSLTAYIYKIIDSRGVKFSDDVPNSSSKIVLSKYEIDIFDILETMRFSAK